MTTLVAPVPEAEPLVAAWRARYDWAAARGVPAHITLLGPFLPPGRMAPDVVAQLDGLFADCAPFSFAFVDVRLIGEAVCLVPEPVAPFERLTSLLQRRFPEAPRYGDALEGPVYHLTVARRSSLLDNIRSELLASLPLHAVVSEAHLLEQNGDADVRTVARFRFREAPGREGTSGDNVAGGANDRRP
jgi:hypothetical protein